MDELAGLNLAEFIEINDRLGVTLSGSAAGAPDGEPIHFDSYVKDISDDLLLIDIPAALNPEERLPPGRSISVTFPIGLHELPPFLAEVRFYQKGARAGCWIQLPPAFKNHILQHRQHIRVPVQFPLIVRTVVNGMEGRPIQAESMNLSGGGIRFTSRRLFTPPGQVLVLEFQPDSSYPLFRLKGNVLRSYPLPARTLDEKPMDKVTAVKFLYLDQAQESRLIGFCFRQEIVQAKRRQED